MIAAPVIAALKYKYRRFPTDISVTALGLAATIFFTRFLLSSAHPATQEPILPSRQGGAVKKVNLRPHRSNPLPSRDV
jgi:hypothetical protein